MKKSIEKMYNGFTNEILGGKIMTQLIGAICENGQTVITVSDRMVSTNDMTLTFEQERMKAIEISSHAVILTAGTAHQPDLIREATKESQGKENILDIANVLKNIYQRYREESVIDLILIPELGMHSFKEWLDKQKDLHDHIVMRIADAISKRGLGLMLILAGIDEEGHLLKIHDPGQYTSFDNLSYCCAGIGTGHADAVFAFHRYTRTYPLNDAIYIAFEAKKRAEMAGGVGNHTDILVIEKENGVQKVTEKVIIELEEIYDEIE